MDDKIIPFGKHRGKSVEEVRLVTREQFIAGFWSLTKIFQYFHALAARHWGVIISDLEFD